MLLAHAKPETVFVLRDLDSGRESVDGEKLADTPFLPYSTFKVPNTLIGLETGVIPDEKFSLKWDGTKYQIEAWNHDQDLASALRDLRVVGRRHRQRAMHVEIFGSW